MGLLVFKIIPHRKKTAPMGRRGRYCLVGGVGGLCPVCERWNPGGALPVLFAGWEGRSPGRAVRPLVHKVFSLTLGEAGSPDAEFYRKVGSVGCLST